MLIETDDYVSVAEAAQLLGVSRDAVYKRVRSGSLETVLVGGYMLVLRESLTAGVSEYYTVAEVADILGVYVSVVYRKMDDGDIPYVEVRGRKKVPADWVLGYVSELPD